MTASLAPPSQHRHLFAALILLIIAATPQGLVRKGHNCVFGAFAAAFVPLFPSLSKVKAKASTRFLAENHGADTDTNKATAEAASGVRFLGKGQHAIVRPGVVLVAPTNEFHHYYRQAAIFVHAMGEDDDGVFVVRGVILDHPTPFTLAEMIPSQDSNNDKNAEAASTITSKGSTTTTSIQNNPLGNSFLFRGGDKGGDGVVLLHNQERLGQSVIGLSGIYQGGWDAALAACQAGTADVDDFKVFFNYCEFTEVEIEDLLKSNEDGDCWASVEVSTDMILNGDWDRGDCWRRLRYAISSHMR